MFTSLLRTTLFALSLSGLLACQSALALQVPFEVLSDADNTTVLGSGFIDFDPAQLTGTGTETLDVTQGLTINFTFQAGAFSGTLSQADDDFDGAIASFLNGTPVGLLFQVTTASAPFGFAFAATIESLDATSVITSDAPGSRYGFFTGETSGTGTLVFVPEPQMGSLLLAGLSLRLLRGRGTRRGVRAFF